MADEELEALRKQRLTELQAKHGVRGWHRSLQEALHMGSSPPYFNSCFLGPPPRAQTVHVSSFTTSRHVARFPRFSERPVIVFQN
uniref:Uncharacterized protein n=1 Tax=Terrapene triunguis TaxID=2587831 RepID=A0A674KGF8_9SAUR